MSKKRYLCEEKTLRLIEEVKQRPCIWNLDHEDYNDKYCVSRSWDELTTILEMSEFQIKKKWKALRDTYRKELKKLDGDLYAGTWHYFHELQFLVFKLDPEDSTIDPETGSEREIPFEYLPSTEILEGPIQNDYDVMFLKSLTPYLMQLEPMRRLVVRTKMQDMLLSELAAQNASKPRGNS